MEYFTSYNFLIVVSLVVVLSYLFNIIAKKTNIPSVLLLIITGFLFKQGIELIGIKLVRLFSVLEILGIVGLIMIVLEAALDLELKKDKLPIIIKSFIIALLGLIFSSSIISLIIMFFLETPLKISIIYSLPLSILSSSIVISSVGKLSHYKKEFLIYESTFSDILGIMFFYFMLLGMEVESNKELVQSISYSIILTIAVSFVVSYILVFIFQKINTQVKLFLLISVLILLYAIGKSLHLSSLLIILVFGLVINNRKVFFRGILKKWIQEEAMSKIFIDFKLITIETAFIVRTFFFFIFGATITIQSLFNVEVFIISTLILFGIYIPRYFLFAGIERKSIKPQMYIAPRGLITILLFFNIPTQYEIKNFNSGILLYVIIATSIIMTYSLIKNVVKKEEVDTENKIDENIYQNTIEEIENVNPKS